MKSRILTRIVRKYGLCNNQLLSYKEIENMSLESGVTEEDLCFIFKVKLYRYRKIKDTNRKVRIKLFDCIQLQEIIENMNRRFGDKFEINRSAIQKLMKKYHVGASDIRNMFSLSYNEYYNLMKDKKRIKSVEFCENENKLKFDEEKIKVKAVILDIKYMKSLKRKYYKKENLENMLLYYGVSIDQFINGFSKSKIDREVYMKSLDK